jgi:hypothetical protein
MEWNGMEWNGIEWNRMEYLGNGGGRAGRRSFVQRKELKDIFFL